MNYYARKNSRGGGDGGMGTGGWGGGTRLVLLRTLTERKALREIISMTTQASTSGCLAKVPGSCHVARFSIWLQNKSLVWDHNYRHAPFVSFNTETSIRPTNGTTEPFLSQGNPLWTPSNQTSRHYLSFPKHIPANQRLYSNEVKSKLDSQTAKVWTLNDSAKCQAMPTQGRNGYNYNVIA